MSEKFKVLGYPEFGSGLATQHAHQAQDSASPVNDAHCTSARPNAPEPFALLTCEELLDDIKSALSFERVP